MGRNTVPVGNARKRRVGNRAAIETNVSVAPCSGNSPSILRYASFSPLPCRRRHYFRRCHAITLRLMLILMSAVIADASTLTLPPLRCHYYVCRHAAFASERHIRRYARSPR
jgi:hypothetical protein